MADEKQVVKKRKFLLSELFGYIKHTGKWWMLPVIIMIILTGLIIIAGGSTLSPFIYALI